MTHENHHSNEWEKNEPARQRVDLPSGRVALFRAGVGLDLVRARRAIAGVEREKQPMSAQFALIAQLALIDGKPVTLEDVLDLPLHDAMRLLAYSEAKNASRSAT